MLISLLQLLMPLKPPNQIGLRIKPWFSLKNSTPIIFEPLKIRFSSINFLKILEL